MPITIWRAAPLDVLVNNAAATFIAQTEHLSARAADAAPTRAFAAALNDSPWFSNITFAILDRRPHRPIHTTFDNILRG